MQAPPKRSRVTDLTDDELLLFDFLATDNAIADLLSREAYQIHLNVPYTHGLSDSDLCRTWNELEQRRLIHVWTHSFDRLGVKRVVGLTPNGGKLWELERNPNWERFCFDIWGDECLSICCLNLETAYRYLKAVTDCGFLQIDAQNIKLISHMPAQREDGLNLIPWKIFPVGFEIVVPSSRELPVGCWDWASYQRQRTWWRDITELATLRTER